MPPDDLARIFDDPEPPSLLRQAVDSGHVDPALMPTRLDTIRNWARFTAPLPELEREASLADRLAVWMPLFPNAEQVARAALNEALAARTCTADPAGPFIDWPSFWAKDHADAEWTYDDVLARGRGHAIYAQHKTGKSLLMLWIAAQIIQRPTDAVLYLDYEMTEADLYDRLDDMGIGAHSDLSRLHYALLPSLPPLDTPDGAAAVMELAACALADCPGAHLTVAIDTMSRAVQGEENDADTFRNFYNHTGIRLKRQGYTWARLDHAGKDASRGQRGSSSKGDDVDVIWKLAKTEHGLELKRDASRMSWVPEHVLFKRSDNPLNYVRAVMDWPEGTKEVALHLDRIKAPIDIMTKDATVLLKEHGVSRRRLLISAACRWRRQVAEGRDDR